MPFFQFVKNNEMPLTIKINRAVVDHKNLRGGGGINPPTFGPRRVAGILMKRKLQDNKLMPYKKPF